MRRTAWTSDSGIGSPTYNENMHRHLALTELHVAPDGVDAEPTCSHTLAPARRVGTALRVRTVPKTVQRDAEDAVDLAGIAGRRAASASIRPRRPEGRVQASLTAGPLSPGGFTCPSGQRLVLASVTYSNVVLTG